MLRAIRNIFNDAKAELASGYIVVGNSQGFASNVPVGGALTVDPAGSLAVAASAIVASKLKYKINTFSLAGDAVGTASAMSVTYSILTNGKIIGAYLTKLTSHANIPLYTQAASAIKVSVAQALIGTDLCEGVIITIEP